MITEKKKTNILLLFISIFGGITLGCLLMLVTGYNPIILITSLIKGSIGIDFGGITSNKKFFNPRYIGEFLTSVMPLWMTGLSVALAFRAGLFNIGAEGQTIAGAIASSVAALLFPPISILHVFIVICSGILCGMIWGAIPGILKGFFEVNEVVVTIMLNYVALYTGNFVIKLLPAISSIRTEAFPKTALLHSDFLQTITNNSRFHTGIFISIFAFIVFHIIMEKTTLGFSLKATGSNTLAAKHVGINVKKNIIATMAISGGFAGLAGVFLTIGTYGYGRILTSFENFGFNGIAVALLGNNTGIGVLLSGLLFGSLQSAQPLMQIQKVSKDITIIVTACIIFYIAMKYGLQTAIENYRIKTQFKKNKITP